MRYKLQ